MGSARQTASTNKARPSPGKPYECTLNLPCHGWRASEARKGLSEEAPGATATEQLNRAASASHFKDISCLKYPAHSV